jgi:hypothetical protein
MSPLTPLRLRAIEYRRAFFYAVLADVKSWKGSYPTTVLLSLPLPHSKPSFRVNGSETLDPVKAHTYPSFQTVTGTPT